MAVDILQRFLTNRLFDVGADDKRVEALRQTAADVTALVKAMPQRTATLTMVAIDGTIAPEEPIVGEVMKILEKHWQSYANAFADDKLPTVARAVLLHGLSAAASSDAIATAISLTAHTMLPHLGDTADRDLWTEVVGDADRRLIARAEREWALPGAASTGQPEFTLGAAGELSIPNMPREWLAERLEWAVGPTNAAGEAFKQANPNWPSNSNQPWAHEFASRAANAISGAVNSALKSLAESIAQRNDPAILRDSIAEYVSAASSALTRTAIGLERRTALLWWKEALYSPAGGISYRDLDPAAAAALAALDASSQSGAFAPHMTEAVVRETLRSIDQEAMLAERPLLDQANSVLHNGPVRTVIQHGYSSIHSEPGRTPLGALLTRDEALTSAVMIERLGLPPDLAINAVDLGVWLYRDLQAAAATPEPVKLKRKGRAT